MENAFRGEKVHCMRKQGKMVHRCTEGKNRDGKSVFAYVTSWMEIQTYESKSVSNSVAR